MMYMSGCDDNNHKDKKKPFSLREWLFGMSSDRKMFWLGLLLGIVALIGWMLYPYMTKLMGIGECRFKEVTGLYCPGCGGTRAVKALFSGHIIKSVIYHPFVPYCVLMWIVYEGSHLLEMIHVPKAKGMRFRYIYIYIGIFIIFINWIIKNILLFVING